MGHMQQIVEHGNWLCVETHEGTLIYAEGDRSVEQLQAEHPGLDPETDIEHKHGWCWRFTAPGYLDQYPEDGTWCGVFKTEQGALDGARDFADDYESSSEAAP